MLEICMMSVVGDSLYLLSMGILFRKSCSRCANCGCSLRNEMKGRERVS